MFDFYYIFGLIEFSKSTGNILIPSSVLSFYCQAFIMTDDFNEMGCFMNAFSKNVQSSSSKKRLTLGEYFCLFIRH